MIRIETVHKRLTELTKERGLSASELADDLRLARSNVSADLNRLCDDGRAHKEGSKPVLYRAIIKKAVQDCVLDRFTQAAPSLRQAVEQAKAAVLYPPVGMPMLLLGETGVGKSWFAELIYQFAVEMNRLKKPAPFIVFNCADYAHNPELLVSHLFGVKKGTFTGADTDRSGLLERADGGILFLDEVHRLPPQGQEMLFTYFDRGCFRRLGDTETERRVEVLIIAATTEPPASVLLGTFTRRIPMVINIPTLNERGLDERLELLKVFFANEAQRIGKPISVSVNAIRALLGYRCINNVGQFKSDIQLLCAKSYSDFVTQKQAAIEIVSANLPRGVREGLLTETKHRQLWNRLGDLGKRFYVFDPEAPPDADGIDFSDETEPIYEMIDQRLDELRAHGLDEAAIERELNTDIKKFFARSCDNHEDDGRATRIRELVGEYVYKTVSEILSMAEERLGRSTLPSITSALSIHVMNSINRVRAQKNITNPEFERIRRNHPQEFSVAVDSLKIIDRVFELSMPLEEAGFLAMFFAFGQDGRSRLDQVEVVVMTHGESTASSMAAACNDLLGLNLVIGIDVPLNQRPQDAYQNLKARLSEAEGVPEVLLLVDMGSLTNFGIELERELGTRVRTVSCASTLHVLQAARKARLGLSLEQIYDEVLKIGSTMTQNNRLSEGVVKEQKGFIVVLCSSGEGTAAFMARRISDGLRLGADSTVEIVTMGLVGTEELAKRLRVLDRRGRVFCTVSPFRLGLGIREFGVDEVLTKNGMERLEKFVGEELLFDKIVEAHRDSFITIDAAAALDCARRFVQTVETNLQCELQDGPRVGIYCHIASLLERLKSGGQTVIFPERESFMALNRDRIQLVKKAAAQIEQRFELKLPEDELCYVLTFFDPGNCIMCIGMNIASL
jgi:transcriptional regulator with AAA-type ATPase domain/transcriptional regulatory protein LevR